MDYDKLIEALRGKCEVCKRESCCGNYWSLSKCPAVLEAADAIEELRAELEQVKRERDAAVSDIETMLAYGGTNFDACLFCKNRYCYARNGTKPCYPEWRGPQEE